MKKRIGSIILTVLLILSLSTTALAAEASTSPDLALEMKQYSNWVLFTADLEDVEATNGRICIKYDADMLTYTGYEARGRWITSVNADTKGEIWFAWAGRDLSSRAYELKLTFRLNQSANGELVITTEMTELYNSGVELEAAEEDLWDEVSINISSGSGTGGSGGEIPLPQPPVETEGTGGQTSGTETNPFVDIDGHWAKEYILKAWQAGLVKGTGDNTFSPETEMTRGMFVTLLYRLNGSPAVSGETPFTDVDDGKYYTEAVLWAYQTAVVKGTSATTFSPEDLMTRQELVTMLFRYAELTGADVSGSAALSAYTDANDVAAWAWEAMKWAVAEGIVNGYAGKLTPQSNSSRAEAATILVRFAGL